MQGPAAGGEPEPVDVLFSTAEDGAGLPAGCLGSSGALSAALAYALSVRAGAPLEPADIAAPACAAERETGLTGGTQDQLASGDLRDSHGQGRPTPWRRPEGADR